MVAQWSQVGDLSYGSNANLTRLLPVLLEKDEQIYRRKLPLGDYHEDTAEHCIFECPHWSSFRFPVARFIGGRDPTPENVADLLCGQVGLLALYSPHPPKLEWHL